MPAHFAIQSIVKKQETLDLPKNDSSVLYPDMTKFHPSGGAGLGQGRAARQAEYAEGFAAGKAEAAQVYEETIRVMEMALESLKSSIGQMRQDIETGHGEVVKQCLKALLPELAQDILRREMHTVLVETTKSQADPHLTVKLHPENEIAKSFLQSSFGETLTLIETNELGGSAVHFSWGNAVTEIDPIKTAKTCLSFLGVIPGQEIGLVDREKIQEAS